MDRHTKSRISPLHEQLELNLGKKNQNSGNRTYSLSVVLPVSGKVSSNGRAAETVFAREQGAAGIVRSTGMLPII